MRFSLNGDWNLQFTLPEGGVQSTSAPVPGNVETVLEASGLLDDCIPADNVNATTRWNVVDDWTYTRTFDAPEMLDGWTCELVFEGIDTIADIYLNGERIGQTRDMFIPHRLDVSGKLLAHNELKVVIRSAMLYARGLSGDIFASSRGGSYYGGQPYLRKARHEWGWDNAPRLLTAGIYRPVYIECLPSERFGDVYLYTANVTDTQATAGIHWNYLTPTADLSEYRLRCVLTQDGQTLYQSETAVEFVSGQIRFSIPRDKVKLWWPLGYGEPALCDVKLEMLRGGEVQAEWTSKWGIRTIKLLRTEDITDEGGEFVFIVNGEQVYINGTNWKPLDALHSQADAKVERALELVRDLNCNMVRIWGGGIYEDTPFFEYCDRHGIMVWQDFMFACEFPPADEWFCRQVYEETTVIVRKLRNHPSLAVWCGDNEDDLSVTWTHGSSNILPSDNKISRKVLPECVLRNDPYRSYVGSSPYVSDACHLDPKRYASAETHLYPSIKNSAAAVRSCRSRFIGETGPIMINAMTDNERIFERERARAERLWNQEIPAWMRGHQAHQMDSYFMSWRQTGREMCELWYGRDFSIDEWKDYCLAVNIICADVFKDIIEFCRTDRPNKTGVIWWSLLDMWPMLFNYSVVDCDFVKKLPYYWIRQSQQPFALMVVRRELDGEAALYAANGTMSRHAGSYRVTAVSTAGEETLLAMGRYSEPANASRMIQRIADADEPQLWLIEWTEDGVTCRNHFVTQPRACGFEVWKRWCGCLAALYGTDE